MDILNLSKEESLNLLNLRKDNLNLLCLDKPILNDKPARVAVVMDYSGSMSHLYKNGTVQAVLERLLPIAMKFDDNGEMELWIFENGYKRMPNITLDNYYGYVNREILSKGYHMGGTEYAPVIRDVVRKYMEEDPAPLADYIIFITDGNNSDKSAATYAITDASRCPIFWQFVGIGNESFSFLRKLDEMDGRYVDNANFFELNDVIKVSDDELYKRLLAEYPQWLQYPEVQELINNPPAKKKKGLFGLLFG
jgi:hypothetical protein